MPMGSKLWRSKSLKEIKMSENEIYQDGYRLYEPLLISVV